MFDLQLTESDSMSDLKTALLYEFDDLYTRYKNHNIYAFALVLDDVWMPECSVVSTTDSLLNEFENKSQYLPELDKWHVDKWQYRAQKSQYMSLFTRKLSQYFQKMYIGPTHRLAHDRFNQNVANFYLDCMQNAKDEILEKYQLVPTSISFFVHMRSNPPLAIQSLERFNPPSSQLFEAIASLQSLIITQAKQSFKLSQVDKALLTDLGQILEIVPYDDMQVAQHAYLMSLEPYFLETNSYIQNLIHEIASMGSGDLVITKQQIQYRINQLYTI